MSGTFQPLRLRRLLAPILIALALISGACTGSDTGSRPASRQTDGQGTPAPVGELTTIDTLRDSFNDDAGSTRLILLISPT